jgi:hypothetical protein
MEEKYVVGDYNGAERPQLLQHVYKVYNKKVLKFITYTLCIKQHENMAVNILKLPLSTLIN